MHYSISGPVFSVDRDTGVVRLRQQLDRETQDLVEVIISITGKFLIISVECIYLNILVEEFVFFKEKMEQMDGNSLSNLI